MSGRMKIYFAATGAWFFALLAVFVFPHPLPTLRGLGVLCFPLLGLILLISALVALHEEKRQGLFAVALLLPVLISFITFTGGITLGAKIHLYVNRGRYETAVARVLAARDGAEKEGACRGDCWIMSAADDRIAFHYAHGFLNWHDIVYDPRRGMEAKGSDQKRRINSYFISAEQITGNWYVGHFGD